MTSRTTRRTAVCLASLSVAVLAHAGPASAAKNGLIAFQAYDGSVNQLFTINPDGSGQRQLTHVTGDPEESAGAENPIWAPDGSKIAFDVGAGDTGVSVFTVPAAGGAITEIPIDPLMFHGDPSYSADGSKIAFDGDSGPRQPSVHGIFVANADGSQARQLTFAPAANDSYDTESQWSPDGKWVAFTRVGRIHRATIWVTRSDGTGLRRLTKPSWDAASPDWSPDGSKILFNNHYDPRRTQSANVYWMRPDGSHKTPLTHHRGGGAHSFRPVWSPDGRRIVFTRATPIGKSGGRVDLYTMHRDGTHLRRVTHMPDAFTTNADWGPRVSR